MLPSVLVRTARDQRRSVTVWAAAPVGDGATLLDSHITIVNAAVGVDGRRGALGWNPPCSPGLGSPGTSTQPALRRRMVQRLGLEWDQPHNGTADLAGVPRGVRRALLRAPPPGPRVMHTLGHDGPNNCRSSFGSLIWRTTRAGSMALSVCLASSVGPILFWRDGEVFVTTRGG